METQKLEIQNLINKFKELKSLVFDYKKRKEKEIKNFSDNQIKLQTEIQNQKNNYESFIDTATQEIEKFIEKNSKDSKLQ